MAPPTGTSCKAVSLINSAMITLSLILLSLQLESILGSVHDSNLKFSLAFGIGLHHAGLKERDRKCVEELFVNQKIQV